MNQEAYTNSGAATFMQDVVEASHHQLVLVDFWASWCGPCRSLAPILEKLAMEYQGTMKLVKVNTDQEQSLATQFGIRSLPTVLFFKEGKVLDQFMGVLPEPAIRQKIEPHATSSSEKALAEARELYQDGQTEQAKKRVRKLSDSMPDNDAPKLLLLSWLTVEGNMDDAITVAGTISAAGQTSPEYRSFQTALELRQDVDLADRLSLENTLADDPENLAVRYRLARLLIAEKEYANAMDHLLDIIRRDRSFQDDGARKTMLKVFELLGGQGELVSEYRTRLSRTLF